MASHAQQQVQLLFYALGTRGDVQPLAVLADSVKCQEPAWAVTLVTHAAHEARTQCIHCYIGQSCCHNREEMFRPDLCRRHGWRRCCSTTAWACRRSAPRRRAPQSRASGSAAVRIAHPATARGAAARLPPWRSACGCARHSFGYACRQWWAPSPCINANTVALMFQTSMQPRRRPHLPCTH